MLHAGLTSFPFPDLKSFFWGKYWFMNKCERIMKYSKNNLFVNKEFFFWGIILWVWLSKRRYYLFYAKANQHYYKHSYFKLFLHNIKKMSFWKSHAQYSEESRGK
jgi:hypothetical protein